MKDNPYLIDRPAMISFSGGRTSAFMLYQIIEAYGGKLPPDVHVVFCNTGLEHEETLKFVERCSVEWDVPVTWLEYRVGKGDEYEKRHTFAVVDYATASRKGEPFSAIIESRRFLPNPVARFCTVELKIRTMRRYASQHLGLEHWTSAVGLRFDEPHRVRKAKPDNASEERTHPMFDAGHTLDDVNAFWAKQPFKLGIPQHLGNCVGCFLKGRSKIEQIARSHPESLAWWAEQEQKVREWDDVRGPSSYSFRSDRPSYSSLLRMVEQQPLLWNEDDFDTMPCNCTD